MPQYVSFHIFAASDSSGAKTAYSLYNLSICLVIISFFLAIPRLSADSLLLFLFCLSVSLHHQPLHFSCPFATSSFWFNCPLSLSDCFHSPLFFSFIQIFPLSPPPVSWHSCSPRHLSSWRQEDVWLCLCRCIGSLNMHMCGSVYSPFFITQISLWSLSVFLTALQSAVNLQIKLT